MTDLKKQLDVAQQITHIGSWEWDIATNRVAWSDELYRIYGLEPQSCEITLESFLARVHPEDREHTMSSVRAVLEHGGRFAYPERILRPDGSVRYLETIGEAVVENAKVTRLIGTCRDITDHRALDEQIALQADIVRNVSIALSVWTVADPDDPSTFRLVAANPAAERMARTPLGSAVGKSFREVLTYAKGGTFESLLAATARDGRVHEGSVHRSNDPRDPTRALAMRSFPLPGGRIGMAVEDITLTTRARLLRDGEQIVLERIARGTDLASVLDALALVIEEHARPALVSILLVDDDGQHIRHGAAPSLPRAYVNAIDGAAIGPKAGSCGTAVHRRAPVYVQDIRTDPLWEDWRELAESFGLRACWSTPIFSPSGRALGTFALYYRDARGPTEEDKLLIARATEIAGIAIQRAQLETRLRDLTAHAEHAREEERAGIARELHDELGQGLTALKIDIAWIGRRITDESMRDKLAQMTRLSDDLIDATRRISSELRPGVLDNLGLLAAIEWQAQDFSARTSIPCEVRSNISDIRIDRETSTALYRVVQEALTNVARHAKATHVDIDLERDGELLRLEVRDDGSGITSERVDSSRALGLLGVRERARRLGGYAVIAGTEGKGTLLAVTVPFRGGQA